MKISQFTVYCTRICSHQFISFMMVAMHDISSMTYSLWCKREGMLHLSVECLLLSFTMPENAKSLAFQVSFEFRIRVVNARTLASRTTQQLAGSSDRSSWMSIYCHGAVIKPTAMNTKPSVDGSQRETSV